MVLAGLQQRKLEAQHARRRILADGPRRKRRLELNCCGRTAVPIASARLERSADRQSLSEAGSTRRTTLKSAPPLANALTSATRAGARTRLVARFRDAEAGSGELSPAIGGTALTDPHSAAATTTAALDAPHSPIAPLMEVTIVRDPPNTSDSACVSTRSSICVELAEAYTTSTSEATIRASSRARRMVRTSGSGRSGQALSGTAALDAATPRISANLEAPRARGHGSWPGSEMLKRGPASSVRRSAERHRPTRIGRLQPPLPRSRLHTRRLRP